MLAISFMILYPFGTVAGSYCTAKYGLRGTVLVGGALTLTSAALRYLAIVLYENDVYGAHAAYAFLFFGQCFAGMAQPFFMNLPTMIADNWFSAEVARNAGLAGLIWDIFVYVRVRAIPGRLRRSEMWQRPQRPCSTRSETQWARCCRPCSCTSRTTAT